MWAQGEGVERGREKMGGRRKEEEGEGVGVVRGKNFPCSLILLHAAVKQSITRGAHCCWHVLEGVAPRAVPCHESVFLLHVAVKQSITQYREWLGGAGATQRCRPSSSLLY